jgi:hypothetical protein
MMPSEMFDVILASATIGAWVLGQTVILVLLCLAFVAWVAARLLIAGFILYVGHQIILAWARAFVASWRPRP